MKNYVRPRWARMFPESERVSATLIALLSAGMGLAVIWLGVNVLRDYGLALFAGVPMAMGFLAPMLHGIGAQRGFRSLLRVSILSQLCLFGGILVLGIEGLICIAMAAPLWLTFALVGTCTAYPIHVAMWRRHTFNRGFPVAGIILLALVPGFMGAEHMAHRESPLFEMNSAIEIDAPPEVVWKRVVSVPDMPPPPMWLFKLGVARPVRAEIQGSGLGATRYCIFSTGNAVEPVRTWDPGRLLEVDVISTPPSMEELSIYKDLHPAHLEGYLESARARFELIPLPGARTRLVGTSWYRNRMFPVWYWRWWSDAAIKDVQVSVLAHIKALSERDVSSK